MRRPVVWLNAAHLMRGFIAHDLPHGMDVDFHLVARAQNERARVLQSPFDVRNRDVHRYLQLRAGWLDVDRKSHIVVLAVEAELSRHFELRWAFRVEHAFRLDGREDDFRVLATLQDFVMHAAVAASITAVSAGCVHDDRASHFARRRVEADGTAFKFECSFNGMKSAAKLELDFRLRWVKLSGNFLCPPGRSKNKCGERREEQEMKSHPNSLYRHGFGWHL